MTDIQDNNDTNEDAPETVPTVEVTATPEEAVAPAPEPSGEEAETPKEETPKDAKTKGAKAKGEKTKKRLVAGLGAAAQAKGASLKQVGVATIRMGSDMLATKHQVFTATEDLAMKGATIQQQEDDKLQVLVHGEFKGMLDLGPAKLSAPTVHDFAASISW